MKNLILCSNLNSDCGVGSTGWFIETSTQTSFFSLIRKLNPQSLWTHHLSMGIKFLLKD